MSAIGSFLAHLHSLGVKLWEEEGYLAYDAPKGVLSPTLMAELVEHKSEILALLRRGPIVAELPAVISAPAQANEPFPLTDVQQAYWLGRSDAFDLGNIATHVYFELELPDADMPGWNGHGSN